MKRQRNTTISTDLKNSVWDVYIGSSQKKAHCPLCDTAEIYSNATNSGFETAHIVADKFFPDKSKLNVYYLFPSCSACNNICGDMCILDFLYLRSRFDMLKKMILSLYKVYSAEFAHLSPADRLMWKMLQNLYGYDRFKAGGGLINEMPIYSMAKSLELDVIAGEIERKSRELGELSERMGMVAKTRVVVSAPEFF